MDYNQFADTIKAKYPEYKDVDNLTLAKRVVEKHPDYAPIVSFDQPKQEGSSTLDKAGQLFGALVSPMSAIPEAAWQNRQAIFNAAPTAGMAAGGALGGIPGAALGAAAGEAFKQIDTRAFGTQAATQTSTEAAKQIGKAGLEGAASEAAGKYVIGPAVNLGFKGLKAGASAVHKLVLKIGANVPDRAIEEGAKAGWKLPNVKPVEIEQAVGKVSSTLEQSVKKAGEALNKAKADIGLPVTVAEKEAAIAKYGNPFGIGKADIETGALTQYFKDFSKPEELVTAIKNFKESSAGLPANTKAKVAIHLQDQINNFVNWEKSGSQVEGVLKSQSGQLGDIVSEVLPKEVRSRMAEALELQDDLSKHLSDPGKAEQWLRSLFNGKSAAAKDQLKRLADLEAFTGVPVLSDLFKKFAGQDLGKMAGRPFLAATATAGLITHPATAASLLIGQSPRALSAIGRAGMSAADAAAKMGPAALRGTQAGLYSLGDIINRSSQVEMNKAKQKAARRAK